MERHTRVALATMLRLERRLGVGARRLGSRRRRPLFLAVPFGQLEFVSTGAPSSPRGYQGYLRRYTDVDQLNGFDQRGLGSLAPPGQAPSRSGCDDTYAKSPTTDEVELNGVLFRRTGGRDELRRRQVSTRARPNSPICVRYDNTWVDFDRHRHSFYRRLR